MSAKRSRQVPFRTEFAAGFTQPRHCRKNPMLSGWRYTAAMFGRFRYPYPICHAAILSLLAILSGCATAKGPQVIAVSAAQYAVAFDAATAAARSDGMAPAMRDRRSGIIETETQPTGTILEPWRLDNASIGQGLENTVAQQRRRARFEFTPAGFSPTPAEGDQPLSGPDVVPLDELPDLTQVQGDLELRCWVYVERANTPGVRRGTWSRRSTTTTVLVAPEGESSSNLFWTPVARDTAYERRLLAVVQQALGSGKAAQPAPKTSSR